MKSILLLIIPAMLLATPALALSFDNCTEAAEAGYSDVSQGSKGYSADLDSDSDGIACESVGFFAGLTGARSDDADKNDKLKPAEPKPEAMNPDEYRQWETARVERNKLNVVIADYRADCDDKFPYDKKGKNQCKAQLPYFDGCEFRGKVFGCYQADAYVVITPSHYVSERQQRKAVEHAQRDARHAQWCQTHRNGPNCQQYVD